MLTIEQYDVKLNINLENGLYVLDIESGSGKTRLKRLLDELNGYGEPVNSYTYRDYLNKEPIEKILDSSKYRVVVIDRYDIYYPYGLEAMRKAASNMIVLVDCKKGLSVSEVKLALIDMEAHSMEVFI